MGAIGAEGVVLLHFLNRTPPATVLRIDLRGTKVKSRRPVRKPLQYSRQDAAVARIRMVVMEE